MDMCEILKILNHNTILVLKENEEIIVMSKGIGFGKNKDLVMVREIKLDGTIKELNSNLMILKIIKPEI